MELFVSFPVGDLTGSTAVIPADQETRQQDDQVVQFKIRTSSNYVTTRVMMRMIYLFK